MHGQVYLIQPEEFIGTNQVKLGMSHSSNKKRIVSYGPRTRILCTQGCSNPSQVEKELKKVFKKRFTLIKGLEYFQGNIHDMNNSFREVVDKHAKLSENDSPRKWCESICALNSVTEINEIIQGLQAYVRDSNSHMLQTSSEDSNSSEESSVESSLQEELISPIYDETYHNSTHMNYEDYASSVSYKANTNMNTNMNHIASYTSLQQCSTIKSDAMMKLIRNTTYKKILRLLRPFRKTPYPKEVFDVIDIIGTKDGMVNMNTIQLGIHNKLKENYNIFIDPTSIDTLSIFKYIHDNHLNGLIKDCYYEWCIKGRDQVISKLRRHDVVPSDETIASLFKPMECYTGMTKDQAKHIKAIIVTLINDFVNKQIKKQKNKHRLIH